MIIKLKKTVDVNGKLVDEVDIKEDYSGADVIRIQNAKSKGEGEVMAAVVIAATGWDIGILAKMSSQDIIRINNLAQPFLIGGEE